MTKLKTGWLILALLVCRPAIFATEQEDEAPDIELLEFLGSMSEEFDEWEEFIELATAEVPAGFVETEFVEKDDE
jgi:hypothetical protein